MKQLLADPCFKTYAHSLLWTSKPEIQERAFGSSSSKRAITMSQKRGVQIPAQEAVHDPARQSFRKRHVLPSSHAWLWVFLKERN